MYMGQQNLNNFRKAELQLSFFEDAQLTHGPNEPLGSVVLFFCRRLTIVHHVELVVRWNAEGTRCPLLRSGGYASAAREQL